MNITPAQLIGFAVDQNADAFMVGTDELFIRFQAFLDTKHINLNIEGDDSYYVITNVFTGMVTTVKVVEGENGELNFVLVANERESDVFYLRGLEGEITMTTLKTFLEGAGNED